MNRLFSFVLVVLLAGGLGCVTPRAVPATAPLGNSASPTARPYLALGDSYTIGEGAAAADRWPTQLAHLLTTQGIDMAAPDYIARTGWTTGELLDATRAAKPAASYELVSLLIGVNNQYRGQSLAQYRAEFRMLLQQAIGCAGGRPGRVVVLSIPDWGKSPFGQRQRRDPAAIESEIDQFNAVAQDECRQAHVAYINITDLTRAAADSSCQFTSDGLHYSGLQMRLWAERTLPVVQALLQQHKQGD